MNQASDRFQSTAWRIRLAFIVGGLLLALVSNATILLKSSASLPNDWKYFNSLSLVVRSNILQYQSLPVHNPWICGGLDILSNPQNRVFSPFVIADVLFAPQTANLISLLLYGVIGSAGMFLLLQRLGVTWLGAILGSILFMNSTWFGLHFYEGHIPYGSMQLLPFLPLALMGINRPGIILVTSLVHALIILDGGIYTAGYSVLVAVTLILLFPEIRRRLVKSLRDNILVWLAGGCSALLITAPKVLPAISLLERKTPELDFTTMTDFDIFQALFNPLMGMMDVFPTGTPAIGFHEFGCYLTIPGSLIVTFQLVGNRKFRAGSLPWILGAAFWFWVATGALPEINPWKIFHAIPVANYLHIQSRTFILMYFFFTVLVVKAWDAFGRGSLIASCLFLILAAEAIFARNYAASATMSVREPVPGRNALITSATIERHLPFARSPLHYLNEPNTSTSGCYEPSFEALHIKDSLDPHYRGTVWVLPAAAGTVQLRGFTPGRIVIDFETTTDDAEITFNTNALYGWKLDSGMGRLGGWGSGLLTYTPGQSGRGSAVLVYRPWYFLLGPCLLVVGALIALVTNQYVVGRVGRRDVKKTDGI